MKDNSRDYDGLVEGLAFTASVFLKCYHCNWNSGSAHADKSDLIKHLKNQHKIISPKILEEVFY